MTTDNLSMLKALLRSTAVLCVFLTLSLIAMLQHFILLLNLLSGTPFQCLLQLVTLSVPIHTLVFLGMIVYRH